ncbi:MAG: IMP cyclohydrolase [Firmicutes bacterium]|nr:IMP cyclohydrolase [Bacillota bacterium]
MYIGRFVVVGRDNSGTLYVGYRVSGRSQPDRRIVMKDEIASVVPNKGVEYDNPFVTYPCFRRAGDCLVVSNGSQTWPIGEKIISGLPVKDSLSLSLLALEYERDQYHTPRIAAVADYSRDEAWLGIITDSKLEVRKVPVEAGEARLLAVYELTEVTSVDIASENPEGIAQELMELPYEHPICSIASMIKAGYVEYGVR